MSITPEGLSVSAGVILSLAASYLPGFSGWYQSKLPEYKRLIMLGLLVAAALLVLGLSCAGLGPVGGMTVTCDKPGAVAAVRAFVLAAVASQTTFLLSPQKKS